MQPKSNEVLIGKKKFVIVELTCLKRDALLDIIGSITFTEVFSAILPIFDSIENKNEKEDNAFGNLLKAMLTNKGMWGSLMLGIIQVLRIGPTIICLSVEELKDEDEGYIQKNISISQEPVILNKIIELNKLPETIKNYSSLQKSVRSLMQTKNTSI